MSYDYRTYVGPYIQCFVEAKVVTNTRRACMNISCANYGGELSGGWVFCALCGSQIVDVEYKTTEDAVDAWDVGELLNERLVTPGGDQYLNWVKKEHTHIWLPNIGDFKREYWLDNTAFALQPITAAGVAQEVYEFEQMFAADIEMLKQTYGNAQVRWGIIQDYI